MDGQTERRSNEVDSRKSGDSPSFTKYDVSSVQGDWLLHDLDSEEVRVAAYEQMLLTFDSASNSDPKLEMQEQQLLNDSIRVALEFSNKKHQAILARLCVNGQGTYPDRAYRTSPWYQHTLLTHMTVQNFDAKTADWKGLIDFRRRRLMFVSTYVHWLGKQYEDDQAVALDVMEIEKELRQFQSFMHDFTPLQPTPASSEEQQSQPDTPPNTSAAQYMEPANFETRFQQQVASLKSALSPLVEKYRSLNLPRNLYPLNTMLYKRILWSLFDEENKASLVFFWQDIVNLLAHFRTDLGISEFHHLLCLIDLICERNLPARTESPNSVIIETLPNELFELMEKLASSCADHFSITDAAKLEQDKHHFNRVIVDNILERFRSQLWDYHNSFGSDPIMMVPTLKLWSLAAQCIQGTGYAPFIDSRLETASILKDYQTFDVHTAMRSCIQHSLATRYRSLLSKTIQSSAYKKQRAQSILSKNPKAVLPNDLAEALAPTPPTGQQPPALPPKPKPKVAPKPAKYQSGAPTLGSTSSTSSSASSSSSSLMDGSETSPVKIEPSFSAPSGASALFKKVAVPQPIQASNSAAASTKPTPAFSTANIMPKPKPAGPAAGEMEEQYLSGLEDFIQLELTYFDEPFQDVNMWMGTISATWEPFNHVRTAAEVFTDMIPQDVLTAFYAFKELSQEVAVLLSKVTEVTDMLRKQLTPEYQIKLPQIGKIQSWLFAEFVQSIRGDLEEFVTGIIRHDDKKMEPVVEGAKTSSSCHDLFMLLNQTYDSFTHFDVHGGLSNVVSFCYLVHKSVQTYINSMSSVCRRRGDYIPAAPAVGIIPKTVIGGFAIRKLKLSKGHSMDLKPYNEPLQDWLVEKLDSINRLTLCLRLNNVHWIREEVIKFQKKLKRLAAEDVETIMSEASSMGLLTPSHTDSRSRRPSAKSDAGRVLAAISDGSSPMRRKTDSVLTGASAQLAAAATTDDRHSNDLLDDDIERDTGSEFGDDIDDDEDPVKRAEDEVSASIDLMQESLRQTLAMIDEASRKLIENIVLHCIYYENRDLVLEQLYALQVEKDAVMPLLHSLNDFMVDICSADGLATGELSDVIVASMLNELLAAYERILLDGGPNRIFFQMHSEVFDHDLDLIRKFFVGADSSGSEQGLSKQVVSDAMIPLEKLVAVLGMNTKQLIDAYGTAPEEVPIRSFILLRCFQPNYIVGLEQQLQQLFQSLK